MRFLLDENVHGKLSRFLEELGHEAKRVPPGIQNGEVADLALREERVLITHDSDFVHAEAFPPGRQPGIIFLDIRPRKIEKLKASLSMLISQVPPERFRGKLFLLEEDRFREIA